MTDAPQLYGLLAEFSSPEQILVAATAVHDAGYTHTDAFSPYPVEGLLEALAPKKTHPLEMSIARLVLIAAIFGALTGFGMCWYANVINYPISIGGRPNNSWPAWIPITFELTVLFSALTAAGSMILLNRLPRVHHPLFAMKQFEKSSRDTYFLCIRADDAKFELPATTAFLEKIGAQSVEVVPT